MPKKLPRFIPHAILETERSGPAADLRCSMGVQEAIASGLRYEIAYRYVDQTSPCEGNLSSSSHLAE